MDVVPGLIGAYVPQCTDGGWYESRQCRGSTGYCWCVTLSGRKIPWTERGPGQGDVECTQCNVVYSCSRIATLNV